MKPKGKKTLIGKSNLYLNDIGNPHLHERNNVEIKRVGTSRLGRAIVTDQHIIDVLLKRKEIEPQHHLVLEKYLEMISVATTLGGLNMEQANISSAPNKSVTPKSVILIGVQKRLRKDLGIKKEKVFWSIMINNPTYSKEISECVFDGSESLVKYWFHKLTSPVSDLQEAILNQ